MNTKGQVSNSQNSAGGKEAAPSSSYTFTLPRAEIESLLRAMTDTLWRSEHPLEQENHSALGMKDTVEEIPSPGFSGLAQEELEGILATVVDGLWNQH